MTDFLSASALLIGKPCVAAVLRAWPLPVLMLDRISGKKIVDGLRIDLGHPPLRIVGMLKSLGCGAIAGGEGRLVCLDRESRQCNGLLGPQTDRSAALDKKVEVASWGCVECLAGETGFNMGNEIVQSKWNSRGVSQPTLNDIALERPAMAVAHPVPWTQVCLTRRA